MKRIKTYDELKQIISDIYDLDIGDAKTIRMISYFRRGFHNNANVIPLDVLQNYSRSNIKSMRDNL